jgi:radical SAM superfamily enzyme YgiQ (UPF0313 family)
MKVALVNPKTHGKCNETGAPLELGSLAAYLKKVHPEVEIRILDGQIVDVEKEVEEFQPHVVGITATTPQAPEMYRLATKFRKTHTIVLGGVHVSAMPLEAIEYADYVVRGEGEITFANIIHQLERGFPTSTPQIIDGVVSDDINIYPMIDYEMLNMPFYLKKPSWLLPYMDTPIACILTSRGCPYRCVFCYNSGRQSKVRYFNAERVVEEVLFQHEKYGVSNFYFYDDEFLINLPRLKRIAELFEEKGISKWIKWNCQARLTTITPELLEMIAKMGCMFVVPGFESFTPWILNYLKQGSISLSEMENKIALFKNSKVLLAGNFIFGTPGETLKEMWHTFQFYLDHPEVRFVTINVLTPYPGTKLWSDITRKPDNYPDLVSNDTTGRCFTITTVPHDKFFKFIVKTHRIAGVVMAIRYNPSLKTFFGLSRRKVWWWMWLKYPQLMFSQIRYVIHGRPKIS